MFTPKEMLHKGIFGGTYFAELVDYKEFPEDWFKGLDESAYKSTKYLANVNLFKIKSGQSQKEWEAKGWIQAGRGEEVDVGDSISWGFKDGMWLKSLIFLVVATIGILIGFLLLIIPGLYLSAAWFLGIYLLVDKGLSPMDALGKSRELVHEVGFWKVFITIFA